jgi:xylulokinase
MLLGIDVGTSSTKALLLDDGGRVAGEGSAPHTVRAPRRGWAESDPEDWWASTTAAVRAAVGPRAQAVRAVGLSGQMHGVVLADAEGRALRPAILWADARSAAALDAYRALPQALVAGLANPLVTGMAGPSLLWLRKHDPRVYAAAAWALQPKDWLRHRLTGTFATDHSDASATLLYDVAADGWSAAVVERLGLRPDLLAPIRAATDAAGGLRPAAAVALGLEAGIPVVVGGGDTAVAAVGTGLVGSEEAQLAIGTGAQLIVDLAQPRVDPSRRTHLFRAAAPQRWYALAAMQNAGLALEWCLRALGRDWAWAYDQAFEVPPGADGLTFLPYLSGERTPHLDPCARGGWIGLGLDHGPATMMRAALEGVAYGVRDGLDALHDAGHLVGDVRLVGGGTGDPRWRQLLADVLGRALVPVDVPHASARGAALLAGAGAGLQPQAAPEPSAAGARVEPGPDASAYAFALRRFRDVGALARPRSTASHT